VKQKGFKIILSRNLSTVSITRYRAHLTLEILTLYRTSTGSYATDRGAVVFQSFRSLLAAVKVLARRKNLDVIAIRSIL